MHQGIARVRRTALMVFCAAAISGCGPGIGHLSGKVSYKGKADVSGSVVLIASDGIIRYSPIQPDGSYRFVDLPVGEAKLGVNSPNPVPDAERIAASAPGAKRGGREQQDPITATPTSDPKLWFPLPPELADPNTSQITTKVKRGENAFNIEM